MSNFTLKATFSNKCLSQHQYILVEKIVAVILLFMKFEGEDVNRLLKFTYTLID